MKYEQLLQLNPYSSNSLDDLKVYHQGLHAADIIKYYDDKAEYNFKTETEGKNFNAYHGTFSYRVLKDYGFRLDKIPKTTNIGAFGCSFTFGEGVAEDKIWHQVLGRLISKDVTNFGVSGTSISTICNIFHIISKHVIMEKAIFLFPGLDRIQLSLHDNSNNLTREIDILPSSTHFGGVLNTNKIDDIYKVFVEEELVKIFKNNLYILDQIAKVRDIKVYVTTWESFTFECLSFLKFENIVFIPLKFSYNNQHLGRDNRHPGKLFHQQFAESILPYINKE